MSWWTRKGNRRRIEEQLDAELRDHVERQVADHVRAGMSAREARRRARLEFGGLDQVKEICRDVRGTRWIEETWQDLRFAIRLLGRERWFAAAAILALGLGIGLTSSAFTVYNAVLVRGLPVDDPDRIMTLAMRDADGREQGISYLDFQDWRAAATNFEDIAAYSEPPMNVGHPDMATEVFFGARVTANAFRLLGIEPLIGRDFQPNDDRPGAPAVVMLGHDIWRNRYGADPDVAPNDTRMPTSRDRRAARARSRLAPFAQAMSGRRVPARSRSSRSARRYASWASRAGPHSTATRPPLAS